MRKLLIGGKHEVLYDDEDAEYIEGASWWLSGRYARTRITIAPKVRISLYMHRLVIRAPEGTQVHHINENTLDNRRVNLRLVSPVVNAALCAGCV